MSLISFHENIAILNLNVLASGEGFQAENLFTILKNKQVKAVLCKIDKHVDSESEGIISFMKNMQIPLLCCFCEKTPLQTIKNYSFADIKIAADKLMSENEKGFSLEQLLEEGWVDYLTPAGNAFNFALEIAEKITKNRDGFLLKKIVEATRISAAKPFDLALEDEVRIFCELAQKAYRHD